MKNYIRKYYDLIDDGKGGWVGQSEAGFYGVEKIEEPKLFEFHSGNYYRDEKFKHVEFFPSIEGYYDSQMEKGFISDKTLWRGYKCYSLIFSFLFWYVEIQLNIRTNKMEK